MSHHTSGLSPVFTYFYDDTKTGEDDKGNRFPIASKATRRITVCLLVSETEAVVSRGVCIWPMDAQPNAAKAKDVAERRARFALKGLGDEKYKSRDFTVRHAEELDTIKHCMLGADNLPFRLERDPILETYREQRAVERLLKQREKEARATRALVA